MVGSDTEGHKGLIASLGELMARRSAVAAGTLVVALVGGAVFPAAPISAQSRHETTEQRVEWGPLAFRYSITPSSAHQIEMTGRVTNTAHRPIELRIPWCLAWLRVYQKGELIWDRGRAESCGEMARFVTLGPGESEVDRYVLDVSDLQAWDQTGRTVRVAAYLPGHRVPWLPPRAVVEVPLGEVALRSADDGQPVFARTLGLPGLPWRSSPEDVRARLLDAGFQVAGSDPNGSLLFNGHDFLGRNAGLIARIDGNRLVKVVALMEPNHPAEPHREFQDVRERLEQFYGPALTDTSKERIRVRWRRAGPGGFYRALLRLTEDGTLRVDFETPMWSRLHGDGGSVASSPHP